MSTKENVKNTETKPNKIINTIVNVILVVAILFGGLCAFTAVVSKEDTGVPSVFGVCMFVIKSESMSPTFDKGDVIVGIKVKDASKLEAESEAGAKDGDIITYETVIQGQVALNSHRIVEKTFVETPNGGYWSFVTQGDNPDTNPEPDALNTREGKIVSKYLFHISSLGTFISFLQSSKGFFIVIFLPVALFFVWQIVQFFRSLFAYQAEKTRLEILAQMGKMDANKPEEEKIENNQKEDEK